MLNDLIKHVGTETGLTQSTARAAIGIILNAAERQASPFASAMFKELPGARTLAAKTGSEMGTATGEIARLIERTPGGRRYVASQMIRSLHNLDLGHQTISRLLPVISEYVAEHNGLEGFGHLGDLIGTDLDADAETQGSIAA